VHRHTRGLIENYERIVFKGNGALYPTERGVRQITGARRDRGDEHRWNTHNVPNPESVGRLDPAPVDPYFTTPEHPVHAAPGHFLEFPFEEIVNPLSRIGLNVDMPDRNAGWGCAEGHLAVSAVFIFFNSLKHLAMTVKLHAPNSGQHPQFGPIARDARWRLRFYLLFFKRIHRAATTIEFVSELSQRQR